MARGAPAFAAAIKVLSQLLKAEMAEREVRSIAYHMKAARFPDYKDLSGFNFAASEVNEVLMRQLLRCEFMDAAENVALIRCPAGYAQHAREGVDQAQGNRTSRPPLAFRPLSIIANACASSRPSSWSMRWSRKRPRTRLGRCQRCW